MTKKKLNIIEVRHALAELKDGVRSQINGHEIEYQEHNGGGTYVIWSRTPPFTGSLKEVSSMIVHGTAEHLEEEQAYTEAHALDDVVEMIPHLDAIRDNMLAATRAKDARTQRSLMLSALIALDELLQETISIADAHDFVNTQELIHHTSHALWDALVLEHCNTPSDSRDCARPGNCLLRDKPMHPTMELFAGQLVGRLEQANGLRYGQIVSRAYVAMKNEREYDDDLVTGFREAAQELGAALFYGNVEMFDGDLDEAAERWLGELVLPRMDENMRMTMMALAHNLCIDVTDFVKVAAKSSKGPRPGN